MAGVPVKVSRTEARSPACSPTSDADSLVQPPAVVVQVEVALVVRTGDLPPTAAVTFPSVDVRPLPEQAASSQSTSTVASLAALLPGALPDSWASVRESLCVSQPPPVTEQLADPRVLLLEAGSAVAEPNATVPAAVGAGAASSWWPALLRLVAVPVHAASQSTVASLRTSRDSPSASTVLVVRQPDADSQLADPLPVRSLSSVDGVVRFAASVVAPSSLSGCAAS